MSSVSRLVYPEKKLTKRQPVCRMVMRLWNNDPQDRKSEMGMTQQEAVILMAEENSGKNKEADILELVRERSLANPFPKYNHINLSVLERDHVEMYVDPGPDSMNYAGAVHGGLFFTMADFCAATTARTDGRKYVTLSAEVHYMKNVREGRITAKSTLVHRGRTSVLVDVNVYSESGDLLFTARVTMFCVGEYT